MTREEAIKFAEYAQIMADGKPDVQEFYKLAESALRTQQELESKFRVFESNEPLTLDELRTMDGEPVWVQFLHNKIGYWYLIDCHNSEFIRFYRSGFFIIGEYSKNFLAYRRKPEEG